MGSRQVDRTFATVLWGSHRDGVKRRVFVVRYGCLRLRVVQRGGLGTGGLSGRGSQNVLAGLIEGEGNARELTAGQDRRDGTRDKKEWSFGEIELV